MTYLSSLRFWTSLAVSGMEWALSAIRKWLVTPIMLVHGCPCVSCRQVSVLGSVSVGGGTDGYLSPLVACGVALQHHEH